MRNITLAAVIKLQEQAAADRPRPPGWWLDKQAELKITGGYNTKKSNQCHTCFQQRSVNGACGCE